jgi:signal transduction histidine kinase
VRRRLLLSYLLLVAVVLVVLEVPLGVLFARHERAALSAEAARNAAAIAAVAEERLDAPGTVASGTFDRLVHRYGDESHAELAVFDLSGTPVVTRSGSHRDDPDHEWPGGVTAAIGGRAVTGSLVDDGQTWTYATAPVATGAKPLGAVLVSLPTEDTDERIETVWLLLGGLALAILGVAALVSSRMARWMTEPLATLTGTAAEVGAGRLDVRAPTGSGPPELRALAEQFNDMVERIGGLVDAQRRFVADASHQLRTPLTALRLRIENLDEHHDDDQSAAVEAALAEADRLGRLLDGLLSISRAEGARSQPKAIDAVAVAADRCQTWAPLGEEQSVQVALSADARARPHLALVTPGQLEQIIDNLVANALDVSPPGASIALDVSSDDSTVSVSIVDHGPGMTDDQRRHAFDRFWQGTSQSCGRAGLGLAIVHQLATSNHGSVALEDTPGGGLTALVTLPAA